MTHFDAQPEDLSESFDANDLTPAARQIELEFLVALGWTITLNETRTGMMLVRAEDKPTTTADVTTLNICLSDRFDGLTDLHD